jgi:hypothetical protein
MALNLVNGVIIIRLGAQPVGVVVLIGVGLLVVRIV